MKERLLWLYRNMTAGRRKRLQASLRQRGELPIGILFYHRVADRHPNPWTISRRDFSRQLDWLQQHFDIVSLAEAQRRLRADCCNRPTVSITFDDGYAENADFAIPELARRNLTATYFVSTDFVRSGRSFPHDLAAGQPLPPNTIDHLREFVRLGIEIGAHTRTHPNLGRLHEPVLVEAEILGSVQDLEDWLGQAVQYFAFPFGLPENTTQVAVDCIVAAGLAGFCTAYGAWNWPHTAGYHLRRIHADPGIESLENWLTLDPRKLHEHIALPFVEPQLTFAQHQQTENSAFITQHFVG